MLGRAADELGKRAGRLIDRASTKLSEAAESRKKPEPPTLATTDFPTPVSPVATTRALQEWLRSDGARHEPIDIAWPAGVEPQPRSGDDKEGKFIVRRTGFVEERWIVDPKHVATGKVRHVLGVTKKGAELEWPDNDYETQLRRRDESARAELSRVSAARVVKLDSRTGKLHEAEVHWRGTIGDQHVVIDRTMMKSAMRVVGLDDIKLEVIDGSIDDEPFELRWDRGWVTGTIAGRRVAVESMSNRPATSGTFGEHAVARENGGAPIAVGGTTFDLVPGFLRQPGELVVWDAAATGIDPAALYVLREACAASLRDWA